MPAFVILGFVRRVGAVLAAGSTPVMSDFGVVHCASDTISSTTNFKELAASMTTMMVMTMRSEWICPNYS
ncbi:hypothetical protein PR003_g14539 [Phytophthora rubi]|uniref:Secreted protein n=1 Tax=Phytophthora rubi TaxID=129364 RepID=A0A6A4F3M8_9STRA|nr:hypothetical protein PR003_g14539 [Phytophthora rubi]